MANRYFKWSVSDDYPDKLALRFSDKNQGDSTLSRDGTSIDAQEPVIFSSSEFRSNQVKKYSQIVTAAGNIVDEQFKEILSSIDSDGVRYLKARLDLKDGPLFGYYVVIVIRILDVLDREKSTFRHILPNDKTSPLVPIKRVYNTDFLNGEKIGKVKGDLANTIIHEDAVNYLRELKGPGFIPIISGEGFY